MIYYTLFALNSTKSFQRDTAYNLLRYALLHEYNIDMNTLTFNFLEHGKPFFSALPNIHFNISHCNGLAACFLHNSEVGVDAEKIMKYREKVCTRVFSDNELNTITNTQNKDLYFYKIWTLKEAFVKCIGIGLAFPLKTVSFNLDKDSISCNNDGYYFVQKIIDDSFILSACSTLKCDDIPFNFVPLDKIYY